MVKLFVIAVLFSIRVHVLVTRVFSHMSLMYLTVLDLYISQVLNIMASGHLISINCLASCMNLSKGVIWYPFLSVKKMPL